MIAFYATYPRVTEKQHYWQRMGSDDVIGFANASRRNLIWSIARDGEGFLFRAASVEETLRARIAGWENKDRRQSNRLSDFAEIVGLVERHPELWDQLPQELKAEIDRPL